MNPDFLTLYNEELRYLREAGEAFAAQHPQVAQHLGFHRDGVLDPFVERLLEGNAFLTSRVHERLNQEQAELAQNMLTHLAPNWSTPVPSITTVALQPDMTHPQWSAKTRLPQGSRLLLKDRSLGDHPATFITGHDVHVQPVEITHAEMLRQPPVSLPNSLRHQFQDAQSCLHLTLSTQGILPISELDFAPMRLTIGNELVFMHQLLTLLLTGTLRIVLHASQNSGSIEKILPANALRLAGLQDENLLPQAIGELPGTRLLREYFAAPGRFSTVLIDGLDSFLAQGQYCHEFDLFFLFEKPALSLFKRLQPQDFYLFAAVAINLYTRPCNPINLNHQHLDYPLVVDKLNASQHYIHSLTAVDARLNDGSKISLLSLTGEADLNTVQNSQARWSMSRRQVPQNAQIKNPHLPVEQTFLSFSTGYGGIDPTRLRSLLVKAFVCERHLQPDRLQQPDWVLEQAMPICRITLVRHPSKPLPSPSAEKSWLALQLLNVNPLHYCQPEVTDCSSLLKRWLMLFADPHSAGQQKQINSIRLATISHHFERWRGTGPLCWTRGAKLTLDLSQQHHADQGALLFGWILWNALTQYGELNHRLSLTLTLDGEMLTQQEGIYD
jgi:type VI secretion system protein ImpG